MLSCKVKNTIWIFTQIFFFKFSPLLLLNQKNTPPVSFYSNLILDDCETDISTKRGKLCGVKRRLDVFVLRKNKGEEVPKGAN